MASTTTKKNCAKCNKGGGTAMCYGCEQAYCTKHFIEHRQELSQQIDSIGQEHDVLRRDLTNEHGTHPLLARINQWELESIIKIQTAAESARTDLKQFLNKFKTNLKTSVSKMTEELQASRESDDYTELDIEKWTDQLQQFRKLLDSPRSVKIDYESGARSAIHLIKVSEQQSSDSSYHGSGPGELSSPFSPILKPSFRERFIDAFGEIKLSQDGLEAMCLSDDYQRCYTSGIGQYSSGVHHIRFQIEQLDDVQYCAFLGIVNSLEKMSNDVLKSESRFGWWDLDDSVVGGEWLGHHSTKIIRTGDKVTLTLDCDDRRIQLEHHRTKRVLDMPISIRLCQFPWKIVVILIAKNDCVKILQ